ncbi:hypothetical protein H4J50_05985 [Colwellia sp. 6M3]|uniref:hypothetical protein n=1 Tax=Colwellia sp. 6M3 TaxID=2759849 RepID=UPI0015F4419B|nr:hypothetical protein [Colwellia sp. 6M3]MBA6415561.1 hypothetical protein [Colwellia sp. 6M3]
MFIFECEYNSGSQSTRDKKNCLIMFLGQFSNETSFPASLDTQIQKAYNNNLTQDVVILLFPKYLSDEISDLMGNNTIKIELNRYKYIDVQLFSFDKEGNFEPFLNLLNSRSLYSTLQPEILQKDVSEFGYKALMDDRATDVLAKAPAGTNFVKPSGKVLEEFIYASQLARSSCEYQFLAMSLLPYKPKNISIDCIYIDTASISAVAEALTYYISKFSSTICKHVKYKSFSSYTGLEDNKPDNSGCAWIIISASESTNLGKQIVKDWMVKPEQVITILSHKDILSPTAENIGNAVVYCIKDYSSKDARNYSPVKVQVHGESFAVEASPPNEVLLLKAHKPLFIDNSVNKYRDNDVFSVNRKNKDVEGDNPFVIYVDYLKLRENYLKCVWKQGTEIEESVCIRKKTDDLCPKSLLYKWIEQIVQWSIPRNLKGVIVGDSPQDKALFNDFKVVLSVNGFDLSNIEEINQEDQDKMSTLGVNSVLILSSVISSGNCFVDINRSLRLANHNGMRIFATTYTTAPSRNRFKSFNVSVTQGTNGFKYAFFSYQTIYVGDNKNSSWIREKDFLTDLINKNSGIAGIEFWVKRRAQLKKISTGLQGKVGVSYESIDKNLEFAPDFVFWPSNYSIESINLEAVYVTVASILQNLRDNPIKGVTLQSSIYQHSVLSPENFIRFNDAALQSSLWRAATQAELDYRRSEILSSSFQGVMTKIMSSNGARSYICLDLLLAIGIRWIKISKESLDKILDDAEKHLTSPYAEVLVQYLKSEFNSE